MIRLARKNVRFSPLRTLVLTLSFTIVSMLVLMVFSIKPFIASYFAYDAKETFHTIDFYLTYDDNSGARYFSIRELNNQDNLTEMFHSISPVFKTPAILGFNSSRTPVTVVASSPNHLKQLTQTLNIPSLAKNEIIITSSFSKKHNLKQGDLVFIPLAQNDIPFTIVNVYPDDGLLRNDTVFINKDDHLPLFLKSMGIDLNPSLLKNIVNTVYFSVQSDHSIEDAKQAIQMLDYYSPFVLYDAYDSEGIKNSTERVVSLMYVVFSLIIVAVALMIQSLIKILLEERQPQWDTVDKIGGTPLFIFSSIVLELFIYLFIAVICGFILAQQVISFGLYRAQINLDYKISTHLMGLTTLVLMTYVLALITINFYQMQSLQGNKDNQTIQTTMNKKRIIRLVIIGAFSLFGISLSYLLPLHVVSIIAYQAFIRLISLNLLIYCGVHLFLLFVNQAVKSKRSGLFKLYYVKELTHNTVIHQVINGFLIALGLIVLLISTNHLVFDEVDEIKQRIQVDFALVNVINQHEKTLNELTTNHLIDDVRAAYLFRNVRLIKDDIRINYMVSMDSEAIDSYFMFDLSPDIMERLTDNQQAYVVLPDKLYYVLDYQVGDVIEITISPEFPQEEMVIAGFSSIGFSDFIITNINNLEKYQTIPANAFLIKGKGNQELLKDKLITQYSPRLIHVMDFLEIAEHTTTQIHQLNDYFYLIISIIIGCFMFTVFNQMTLCYTRMKPNLAKLMALGYTDFQLIIGFILMNMLIVLTISGFFAVFFKQITKEIPYLLLFFNTYYPLNFKLINGFKGIGYGLMMSGLSMLFIYLKMKKDPLLNDLRNH